MKKFLLTALVLLSGTTALLAQNLVSKLGPNGKWGFVGSDGSFVISPIFDEVQQEFTLGIACVKKDGKTFFINVSGATISDKFVWADNFSDNGLCKVNVGGKLDENGKVTGGSFGFVDISGAYVIKPYYEFIGSFNSYGLALVNKGCKISEDGTPQGGKFGYIDSKGSIVIPIEFDFISEFDKNGMCWVNKGGRKFEGDKTVDAQMDAYAAREKNIRKVVAKREELEEAVTGGKRDLFGRKAVGGLYGMYSYDGTVVIKVAYDKIASFEEGICRVQTKKGYGYVNMHAEEIAPCTYIDAAPAFKEGRAWVKALEGKEALYGYIDNTGSVVINCSYRSVTDFNDKVAIVSKPGAIDKKGTVTALAKYGLIDIDGKPLTDLKYDLISRKGDLLFCKLSGKYCFVTEKGQQITPPVILESRSLIDGQVGVKVSSADAAASPKGSPLASSGSTVKDKGQWVIINKDGTVISDYYDKISDLKHGFYVVEKSLLYGYLNKRGELVIPVEYTKALAFDNGFAPVMNSEKKWGFVDSSGKVAVPCQYEQVSGKIPEGIAVILKEGKWGGIRIETQETVIPFLLTSEKDVITVANTLYVEFGRKALSERSIKLYNARVLGGKSRFSIKDVIGNEYWDY